MNQRSQNFRDRSTNPSAGIERNFDFEPGRLPRRNGTMPETNKLRIAPKSLTDRLILGARSIKNNFAGHVSKTALLTRLLPLSVVSFFGTLIAAAFFLPTAYDWRVRVMSSLTSPRDNPQGCWLALFGIMAAMLLALPFGGYVAQHLHAITPRLARSAGLAFACGFGLMLLALVAQFAQPVIGLRWLHEFLARAAAGSFIVGTFGCCGCALKDRLRCFGGQASLPGALAFYWLLLTLLPAACLAGFGTLVLLGQHAGLTWAEDFRQSFRHTVFWQLAFWEWLGAVLAFAFLTGSALLLPASCGETRKSSGRASALAAASMGSLSRGQQWAS
jgi:hypothetical protein